MQDINEVLLELFLKSLMIYFIPSTLVIFNSVITAHGPYVLKPNSLAYNFVEVSGHNQFSDLRFPYTMFTLQTSFKLLLLGGGGKGGE